MRHLALIALLLAAGCRDFAVDAGEDVMGRPFRSFDVEPNVPFEMGVGDEAYLTVADLTITFSMVFEDTRCPVGETCEQPGRAGMLLDISRGVGDESQIILQIPGEVATPYRLNDFVQHRQERFQLLSLNPYPHADTDQSNAVYSARIVIDR